MEKFKHVQAQRCLNFQVERKDFNVMNYCINLNVLIY